jgi:tocopherol O-methyltransferase
MPDKQRFFDEAFRVLKPGGMLGITAWLACPRPKAWEVRHLLEPICREGRLPGMGDEADYLALAARSGFATIGVQDLSERVRRTWSICAKRVAGKLFSDPRYARFLLASGAANRIFALTLLRLLLAYRTRSMRYGLLLFAKPGAQD